MIYPQITRGISRNMQVGLGVAAGGFGDVEPPNVPEPYATGGGNLNGSQNTAHMAGQAGTGCAKINLPRAQLKLGGGNYCGVV
jgi:hypothetical protein